MLEKLVLLRPLGNVVYLMPPLITPEEVISDTVEKLGDVLNRDNNRPG